jgi:hypothetical protein
MGEEAFDAPSADETTAALVHRFRTARKKLLVQLTVWLLVALAIMAAGGWSLAWAGDTRAMLAALFVMLVGFETSILLKLWYWTVDSKASIVEQIQRLGLRVEGAEAPAIPEGGGPGSVYDRLSVKWLGRVASVLIVVPALAFGVLILGPLFRSEAGVVYRSECHAVLDAAGAARVTGRMAFTYYGVTPLATVRVPTGEKLLDAAWTDAAGHELPSTQVQEAGGWISLVQLAQPVFREGSADLRVTWTIPQAAREAGGTWAFAGDAAWRKGLWPQLPLTINAYLGGVGPSSQGLSTVTAPGGANVARPQTKQWDMWSDYDGRTSVMFSNLQQVTTPVEVRYTLGAAASR